jgi:hypothetical protein
MENNISLLERLYKEFGLLKTDFFQSKIDNKSFVIITRTGIEKIQMKSHIYVDFKCEAATKDYAAVKATGFIKGKEETTIHTFGSATKGEFILEGKKWQLKGGNTDSNYVLEIAEKRALSRVVLKLSHLYMENVYSQDENAEEFIAASDVQKEKGKQLEKLMLDGNGKKK